MEVHARANPLPGSEAEESLLQSFRLLQVQEGGLAELGKQLESQFLAISAALEQLPTASEQLTGHSEKLMRLASGSAQEKSAIEQTLEHLHGPLSYVEEHHTATTQLLSVAEKAVFKIERMLASEQALQRTVAPLKFIRTLYRVESAGLDVSYQQMFQSLTQEIHDLQLQVNETFSSRFEGLRCHRATIKNLVQRLQEDCHTEAATMRRKRQELECVIRDLRENLQFEGEKNQELTEVAKVIAKQVGSLVFSLQAQDVISQKVAHILEAFTHMGATLNTYRSSTSEDEKASSLSYLHQAVSVESAQLRAVARNLDDTETALTSSLSDVLGHLTKIRQAQHGSPRPEGGERGTSSMVATLRQSLADLQGMVQAAAGSARSAYEAVKPIRGQASNVTDTMRTLSAQIKLIALNAQIQAAHIESGTGLEVLAAQTGLIAVETAAISEGVGTELDQFSTHLNELVDAFNSLSQRGVELQHAWQRISSEQAEQLSRYENDVRKERTLLTRSAEEVERLTTKMRDEVALKKIAEERVIPPAHTLDSIHQILETRLRHITSAPTTAHYTRAFTMESERQVLNHALSKSIDLSSEIPPNQEQRSEAAAESATALLVGKSDSSSELVFFDASLPSADLPVKSEQNPTVGSTPSTPTGSPTSSEPSSKSVPPGEVELF